ncbi:unnamed protein product [Leptosia nina]|uniref:Uncharacterized protein n=1 Tax=Leptosia nina TaxID=320188 RepID=A0AAV1JSF1_9NEOP
MSTIRQIAVFLCCIFVLASAAPRPDSAGDFPLPAPGLAYGGIPYGSMSGNVAEFFKHRNPIYSKLSIGHAYAPIEQYL